MPMTDDGLILGMECGECVDNADPLRLGRVRVCIPGLIEPASAWAWPLGFGGETYDVPKTRANYAAMTPSQNRPGDECAVWFRSGHPDQPHYMKAHGGMPDGKTPEVPEPVKTMEPADAPWLKCYEMGTFLAIADDRPATKGVRIVDKVTQETFLEYDAATQGVRVKGVADLTLQADGAVHIIGLLCEIMRRRVMVGSDAI